MRSALKPISEEKTEDLLYFMERGFHQMDSYRGEVKAELIKRGVKVVGLKHNCFCNECKVKHEKGS